MRLGGRKPYGRALCCEERAQGTVEYAVVTSVFVVVVVALALLVRAGQEGVLLSLVEGAASHVFSAAGAVDIALY